MNVSKKIQKATEPEYYPKKDNSTLAITLSVISFFISLLVIIFLYDVTLISFFGLSKWFTGFTVIGFLVPIKLYQKWFHFIKYEVIIFNILGVGPVTTALFLIFNLVFSNNNIIEYHTIEKVYKIKEISTKKQGVILQNKAYQNDLKITGFESLNSTNLNYYNTLKITFNNGLFGYRIIKEKEFINK